jgi:hypothetical protein
MVDDDTDDEQIDDTNGTEDYSAPAADPVLIAIEWCRIAKNKTLEAAIRKLAKLNRQYADTQAKLAAVQAQAAELEAALVARAAALDERDRVLDARVTAFENQAADVRDELREHHNRLEQTHRQLTHRIMATTGILGEWNWDLQSPPTWAQLRQMIAGLPDDPPPLERDVAAPLRIDAFADVCSDPSADRHGNAFLGSLNRDVSHKRPRANEGN